MKWLVDECFDNNIVRGLLRRSPDFDLVRAQDISEVAGRYDETLLAWAAKNDPVVLTHDLATMVPALQRAQTPVAQNHCAKRRFAALLRHRDIPRVPHAVRRARFEIGHV